MSETNVLVGFDGFVDTILHVVKTRASATKYVRMERMGAFGEAISDAAGLSANMEMVSQMQKLGGNGPIMANALGAYGTAVTFSAPRDDTARASCGNGPKAISCYEVCQANV